MTSKSQALSQEQLKAIVPARSREVLDAFAEHGPMTVPELQERLHFPSKSLYYQVKKLLAVGLLTEDGVEVGVRRDLVRYAAVSGTQVIPSGYQGADYEHLAAEHVAASLRRTIRGFRETARASQTDPELVDWLLTITARLSLTPQRRKELARRLDEIVTEFKNDEGEQVVDLVIVQTPRR